MTTIRKIIAAALILAMTLSLCACGKSDDVGGVPESTEGKDVTKASQKDKVFSLNCNENYSFNPLIATNHSNQLVCSLVYENMVEVDDRFNVVPNVIQSWTVNDDATYWMFTIDQSHTFHDGTPVTGKDLRYSLERAITSDRFRGRFASFQGCSYDADKLYVSLGIGDTQFVKLLNIPIIPSGSMDEKKPLGSGPYMYNEDETKLIAYDGHKDYNRLSLKTIELVQYSDAESIISAFEDGIIDAVTNDPSSYTNLGYSSANEIHTYPTTNLHYVCFNQESVLGRYNAFRQAMNYAFDREYFAEEMMHGNAVASALPMYPGCEDYPSAYASSLKYDLDTCKIVLENAGIKDYDEDGMLEYMSGAPQEIELIFIVCSDSSAKAGTVRKFQEDMASIGLKVTVQELSWNDYITALEEGSFDMYYGEVKLRNNFDITELVDNDSDLNYSRSTDKDMENYVNSYLASPDALRMSNYQALCEYVVGTGALISIGFEKHELIVHRSTITNLETNEGNPLYHFADWEIDLD